MGVAVLGRDDLEWEGYDHGRFGVRIAHLGRRLGARKLGYNLEEVLPGRASVPYHAHFANEELIVLLEGEAWVRLDGREHRLSAGAVVALPPGRDSAHQILNRSDRPALALLASTMKPGEWVEYPDSGKRMIAVTRLAGDPERVSYLIRDDRLLRSGDAAAYLSGEPVDEPVGPAPSGEAERDRRIVAFEDLAWEESAWEPTFRARRRRLSRAVGARLLGYGLWRLEPGERICPYHLHHVNEEAFFVLSGRAILRTEAGERAVEAGDVVACPPGAGGAHGFRGGDQGPCEILALSTMEEPEVSEYPDSGKLYVMAGAAPGGDPAERTIDLVFRKADAVDYLDGEA